MLYGIVTNVELRSNYCSTTFYSSLLSIIKGRIKCVALIPNAGARLGGNNTKAIQCGPTQQFHCHLSRVIRANMGNNVNVMLQLNYPLLN